MFEALKGWRNGVDGDVRPADIGLVTGADGGVKQRGYERYPFPGGEVFLFLEDQQRFRLRLRDVSCSGLSGLTDAPLSVGQLVVVQFEETLMPAAQVAWTRNAMVGMRLANPLPTTRMRRLVERHESGAAWSPAMRAASDLDVWWTNVGEHQRGRAPTTKRGRASR